MITSTTKKGTEGFNISWSAEQAFGRKLLKELPKGWSVDFCWLQFGMYDVRYEIEYISKEVRICYTQNLLHWSDELIKEIKRKIKEMKQKIKQKKLEGLK